MINHQPLIQYGPPFEHLRPAACRPSLRLRYRVVALMAVVPGDLTKPTIWDEFRTIVKRHNESRS